MQVRARTSVGYGPYAAAEEVKLSAVPNIDETRNNAEAVATTTVFAILGWIVFLAIIVSVVIIVVWYTRRQKRKKLLRL